jgi:uncharacterized protein (TIGR02246 family)
MNIMQSDEREIRKLVETWLAASKAGDLETVLGLMTDDVVFLVTGQPPMIGKASFAAASKAQSGQPFTISGTSDVQEIQVFGEWAYMWTKLSVVATPTKGGEPIRRAGHTLSILRKQGGKWLLARDANMLTAVPAGSE